MESEMASSSVCFRLFGRAVRVQSLTNFMVAKRVQRLHRNTTTLWMEIAASLDVGECLLLAVLMVSLSCAGCKQESQPPLGPAETVSNPPATQPPPTVSSASGSLTKQAMNLLFGAFTEYRLHGNWSTVQGLGGALDGVRVPDHQLPALGIATGSGFGYYFVQERKIMMALGVNTAANSVSVLVPRGGQHEEAIRLATEDLILERLGVERDVGQEFIMFAALIDKEPVALFTVTFANSGPAEERMLTVGMIPWQAAVLAMPELAGRYPM